MQIDFQYCVAWLSFQEQIKRDLCDVCVNQVRAVSICWREIYLEEHTCIETKN